MTRRLADPRVRGHLALVAAQVCFGIFPLLGKWAFAAFDPRAVASWRIGFGGVVLGTLALARHRRAAWPGWRDLCRLQGCSLLGITINQVLFLEGLERTTSVDAGLMMALIPVFTFAIAAAVRQEHFSVVRASGLVIAFAGSARLIAGSGTPAGGGSVTGNLMIASNALFYSAYLVALRPLSRRWPALVLLGWVYVLGLWSAPLVALGVDLTPRASWGAWAALAAILVFPTVLGYLLNLYALARLGASTTAVYVFFQPLIAAVAGVVVLGEPLAAGTLLAGTLIFAGVWLVVRR